MPYVFQILAQLLESSPAGTTSDNYKSLLGPLLAAPLWETRGNIPACTRLLGAVMSKTSADIVVNTQIEPILGIFQNLLNSKKFDLNAFDLLDAAMRAFEPYVATEASVFTPLYTDTSNRRRSVLDQYFGTILQLIYTKLQGNPAQSLKLRFVRFFHLVSARLEAGYGADYFIKHSDKLDEKAFAQVYPPFVLAETEKLVRPVDRKLAVVALTKTLCDSQVFAQKFLKGWANSCRILLSLLANPPSVAAGGGDEMITESPVDDVGFGTSFTPLNTCKPLARDDFPDIQNVPSWVKEYMVAANQRHNGAVEGFISQRLPPEQQEAIAQYIR